MQNKTYIKEIFESVQGEGPYAGVNQLFIRFASCNLHCNYCDTDFKTNLHKYSPDDIANIINQYKNIHSVSLTGGEPLMNIDFLLELLPKIQQNIYLETNGTLFENLKKVITYINIISMDVKLPSSSQMKNLFDLHKKFIQVSESYNKELFLKVVFDENITNEEIVQTIELAKKKNLLIVLQPKMDKETLNIKSTVLNKVFYDFISLYKNVRLIPQMHKFLNVQ